MKDLSELNTVENANEGFELQLFSPGDMSNVGIFITILGRDSEEYRKLQNEHNRRRMAKVTKGGGFRIGTIPPEEIEQDGIQLLVACTKSWRQEDSGKSKPTLTLSGKELDCSKVNATRLYTDYPWIKEQVEAGVIDRANFIKR